jgi:hypothetical protein
LLQGKGARKGHGAGSKARGGKGVTAPPPDAVDGALDDADGAAAGPPPEEEDDGFDWPSLREGCLHLLIQVVGADGIRRMWPLGVPEEEFVGVFAKTGERGRRDGGRTWQRFPLS